MTGKLNWMAAAFGSLIPLIPKFVTWTLRNMPSILSVISKLRTGRDKKAANQVHGQQSEVTTRYLVMTLDHDTGGMNGKVIKGEYAGKMLNELSVNQIRQIISQCDDDETISLLMAYLDRYHRRSTADESHDKDHSQDKPEFMSIHEAREILGVAENASKNEIIESHRSLIQKMHPDRGGSEYLAAKINRAKDVLISAL